jgi:hypothetical protein
MAPSIAPRHLMADAHFHLFDFIQTSDGLPVAVADLDMPVSEHSDVTSIWETQNPIYLSEITEALRKHPETKFVWCHAGGLRVNHPAMGNGPTFF